MENAVVSDCADVISAEVDATKLWDGSEDNSVDCVEISLGRTVVAPRVEDTTEDNNVDCIGMPVGGAVVPIGGNQLFGAEI